MSVSFKIIVINTSEKKKSGNFCLIAKYSKKAALLYFFENIFFNTSTCSSTRNSFKKPMVFVFTLRIASLFPLPEKHDLWFATCETLGT